MARTGLHLLMLVDYVTEKPDFPLYAIHKDRRRLIEYPSCTVLSGGPPDPMMAEL